MTFHRTSALYIMLLVLIPARLVAHDIPSDVRIQMFVKPEGQRLRVLVRVPLQSITETQRPERRPDLRDAALRKIANELAVFEGGRRITEPQVTAVLASLPSDLSFDSYEQALAHVMGPGLADDFDFVTQEGLLDALLDYDIRSETSAFSIDPHFVPSGVTAVTTLRFLPPDRRERTFSFRNDPGLVRLDPRWFQAAGRFVAEGFFHIPGAFDYLLFLFCVIIPFRRLRPLLLIAASFAAAHSITLMASVYDVAPEALWFPPLVETLMAFSIVYIALENIVSSGLQRRWILTFAFGLVHGFGLSFAFRESLPFAGEHRMISVLAFNIGVELGQLLVLLVFIPALGMVFRYVVAERPGGIILSVVVVHTGWHWLTERYAAFRLYPIEMPVYDAAFLAAVLRWLMLCVIAAGAAWIVFSVFGHRESSAGNEAIQP